MPDELWKRGFTNAGDIPDSILFSRLADTIAWCIKSLADSQCGPSMRSSDLLPRMMHDGRDDAVCDVGSTRHWMIRETSDALISTFPDLRGGRLMVYFPDADACDGAAEVESDGFFDVFNTPPWDTWVCYFDDDRPELNGYDRYLLAYVPEQLLDVAAGGILVNPEQCIAWLLDADVMLSTRLSGIVT